MSAWIYYPLLLGTSTLIARQDFKDREVSLWLLVVFTCITAVFTYLEQGWLQLLQNGVFCLLYFTLCFTVVFLYYFVRERRWPQIIDSKIGKADMMIFFAIGLALQPVQLIVFFTLAFALSLLIALLLSDKKQVPLAGLLVVIYVIFDIFNHLIH